MKSTILKIVLAIGIIVLGYFVYASIMEPIRFERTLTQRNARIVTHIKDIRSAQTLYKQFNNKYTGSFDTLLDFLRNGRIPVVKMIADPTDTTFTRTINDTIGYVAISDSLFSNRPNFKLNELPTIPYSNGQKFNMKTDIIDRGGVLVPVIEIVVPYNVYLSDLNQQDVVNLAERQKSINRYPGLVMGSLIDATTDGNWE